ncbi:MAG: hypothetical protein H7Y16_09040, partial [Candidatus Parcubacteria bacterium]|nr:hypothetical protein [Burkholderiales bacterium]
MTNTARWIRSGPLGPQELHALCIGLALAQGARAAPVVFWARAADSVPDEPCSIEQGHFAFALVVPLRL